VRLVAAIPSVLLAVLLAQSSGPASRQSRERADGGPILLGTDPPGRLRPEPATDAGATVQRDAGAEPVQPLQQQLQQLRARIDALERERAEAQQNARQLDDIVQELQQLRQQVADAEGRRQAAETQQQAQRASMQTAVDSLYVAQQRLAGGDYAIEAQLDQAQAAFTGQAQRDVQAARVALRNRDLAAARALLSAAISHAQAGR
jgi:DNA repair exonuclease SbcCD ATPase subunit